MKYLVIRETDVEANDPLDAAMHAEAMHSMKMPFTLMVYSEHYRVVHEVNLADQSVQVITTPVTGPAEIEEREY